MKLISTRVLALAVAALALASCSSEPSDWRPDDKVSLDMIPPGTRPTGSVGEGGGAPVSDENGGAIADPINSDVDFDKPHATAEGAMSANSEEGLRQKGLTDDAGKAGQEDTTAGGHEVQR